MFIYPAIFTDNGNGFTVTFPDLRGCITEGDSKADAASMARDTSSSMMIMLDSPWGGICTVQENVAL